MAYSHHLRRRRSAGAREEGREKDENGRKRPDNGLCEELVSLTELEFLVEKLDATKNGTVDYTLFVAALIPMDV